MPMEKIRARYTEQELLDLGDSKGIRTAAASMMLTTAAFRITAVPLRDIENPWRKALG